MRIALISLLLAGTLLAYTPVNLTFPPARSDFGSAYGINWRVFRVDQWWRESSPAERAQAVCVAAAWTGTIASFTAAPFYEKHKWARTVCRVAAVAAVGGLFGNLVAGGLRAKGL